MTEKVVHIREEERKFVINDFSKKGNWDREFLIYQWYEHSKDQGEKKDKLIFDLLDFSVRYVAVTKYRKSSIISEKKVNYYDISNFEVNNFLFLPFVLKRRSIKADIHLDHFIYSNGLCKYLLELENSLPPQAILESYNLFIQKEVSFQKEYRNSFMCIPFDASHAVELKGLLAQFKSI